MTIKKILMDRDGMSDQEADGLIQDAINDFYDRLSNGDSCSDICGDWFGLEEDYIMGII